MANRTKRDSHAGSSNSAQADAQSPLPGKSMAADAMTEQERHALRVWTVLAAGLIAIALSVLYALA